MHSLKIFLLLSLLLAGPCSHAQLQAQAPQGIDLSGAWKLDKKDSDHPRKRFADTWKTQQGRLDLKTRRKARMVELLGAFLFPYSDWIEVYQEENGIGINYGEGEYREYWTDEKNIPAFTGLYGETIAGWQDARFIIETEYKEEDMQTRETFVLSEEGNTLINTIVIEWNELKQPLKVNLIYHRKTVPSQEDTLAIKGLRH